jgi:hypothetical protein
VRGLPLVLLVVAFARAAAADVKEWTVAVTPAASLIHLDGGTAWGGGVGAELNYGVTEGLALHVSGAFTAQGLAQSDATPGGAVLGWFAGAGVTYAIDILRVVPYFDFSLGYLGTRRPTLVGSEVAHDFGVEVGLGVDYLVNRRISVGAVVRYHASLTAIADLPAYLYVGPRLAIHFGG